MSLEHQVVSAGRWLRRTKEAGAVSKGARSQPGEFPLASPTTIKRQHTARYQITTQNTHTSPCTHKQMIK